MTAFAFIVSDGKTPERFFPIPLFSSFNHVSAKVLISPFFRIETTSMTNRPV